MIARLRGYGYVGGSGKGEGEAGEDREVGVKLHLRQPSHPERRQTVVRLEVRELPFHGCTATVEVAEPLRVTSDPREQTPAQHERHDWLPALRATERDDRLAAPLLALGVDAAVVVALVRRTCLGLEPASDSGVQQRCEVEGFLPSRCLD